MKKIRVCQGPHCSYRKSNRVLDALRAYFTSNNDIDLNCCPCTGFCEQGPNVVVNDELVYCFADPKTIGEKVKRNEGAKISELKIEDLKLDDDLLGM